MTRASDAARNRGNGSANPAPDSPADTESTKAGQNKRAATDKSAAQTPSTDSSANASAKTAANQPAKTAKAGSTEQGESTSKEASRSGDASSGASSGPSAGGPRATDAPRPGASPPRRPPLPGPPPGARWPGPPMMGGPRFAPPPPRRQLTGSQRTQLAALITALIAIGGLLGYLVSLVLPAEYAAQTTIQYNIAGENTGDFLKTDRNLTTQVVLITSRNVLQPVADAAGVPVDDLAKKVKATVLNSSNVIMIEVTDRSREAGINLANAIAEQYLKVANSSGPRGYLQSQLDEVKRQQATPRPGITAAETAALAARAATLQAQLDSMNLTTNQSTVLAPAYSVTDPVSPNKGLALITGAVCGLIIAVMASVNLTRRWTARS